MIAPQANIRTLITPALRKLLRRTSLEEHVVVAVQTTRVRIVEPLTFNRQSIPRLPQSLLLCRPYRMKPVGTTPTLPSPLVVRISTAESPFARPRLTYLRKAKAKLLLL